MTRSRKFANPFYGLLLVAGITFALTATAYGVMAFRDRDARQALALNPPVAADVEHPLMTWMSQHGTTALLIELGFLALCTFAAIGTDSFWQRRVNQRNV